MGKNTDETLAKIEAEFKRIARQMMGSDKLIDTVVKHLQEEAVLFRDGKINIESTGQLNSQRIHSAITLYIDKMREKNKIDSTELMRVYNTLIQNHKKGLVDIEQGMTLSAEKNVKPEQGKKETRNMQVVGSHRTPIIKKESFKNESLDSMTQSLMQNIDALVKTLVLLKAEPHHNKNRIINIEEKINRAIEAGADKKEILANYKNTQLKYWEAHKEQIKPTIPTVTRTQRPD